jgi:hypothetical protein
MQQAECAHSAPGTCASSGNVNETSATSRRGLIGLVAAAGVAALAVPLVADATPAWDAHDWMQRWWAEGCGLEVGGNALHLKGRLNGDRAAIGALMVEVAPPARQSAVIELMERHRAMLQPAEDPALVVVRELEAIDADFISEDVDPAANEAWLARWDRAFDKLPWAPASTGKGRAAKLRYAIEYMDTPRGNKLMSQILRYLETEA